MSVVKELILAALGKSKPYDARFGGGTHRVR